MADAPALGAIPALFYASHSDRDAADAELCAPRRHGSRSHRWRYRRLTARRTLRYGPWISRTSGPGLDRTERLPSAGNRRYDRLTRFAICSQDGGPFKWGHDRSLTRLLRRVPGSLRVPIGHGRIGAGPPHRPPGGVLSRWCLLLAALVVFVAGACESQARIPSVAGVVRDIQPAAAGQSERYVLDGAEVVIDQGRDAQLYPPGHGSPRVGDLLVVGTGANGNWYLVIPPGPSSANGRPCFALWATGVDRGAAIDTNLGVRLPKAPDFDHGSDTNGVYEEQPHSFCLDQLGAIYRWV
jgi:hypothetical protein